MPTVGTPVWSLGHYQSTGGVAVGGIFSRMAAFALRLGDFNFLISNQITSKRSRDVLCAMSARWPKRPRSFLTFGTEPYAVIANGEVDYVLDGYTTTTQYPYSENASTLGISMAGFPAV